jgi:malate dehydrogenase (oxaloacetate-decarboxylating)(NADP+)
MHYKYRSRVDSGTMILESPARPVDSGPSEAPMTAPVQSKNLNENSTSATAPTTAAARIAPAPIASAPIADVAVSIPPTPARGPVPTGEDLLNNPRLNKGTAFNAEERKLLKLRGLLPSRIIRQDTQIEQVMNHLHTKSTNLGKYIYLMGLQDRNETLFYRVLIENMQELMPIVYTPTIGEACLEYSQIFRRPRGLFISYEDRGHIRELIANWPVDDVRVIVVTDGERILGLGDLGAQGMGIPVGKLSLYTACAGMNPEQCLPITLDVGTNDLELLADPLYIGSQHTRIRGAKYDAFVDEFLHSVRQRWPKVLVQFEDFANSNAFRLLHKYRDQYCVFNDDIQGTAAVTLAGLYSALRISRQSITDQRIVMLGAGEAATGIGNLIVKAMCAAGMTEDQAHDRIWLIDSKGLIVSNRTDLTEHKQPFAKEFDQLTDLAEIVTALKPTALIGASGQTGTFTPAVLKAVASYQERPIVFSLSNPTANSECTAEEAYKHTDGRAIFASGSPFAEVKIDGKSFTPGQANNAYVFPGIGLGVVASETRHVTDEMFFVAAKTLAMQVTTADLALGRVYPSLSRIRQVSTIIAAAVASVAFERGLTDLERPDDLHAWILSKMYDARYENLL